MLNSIRRKSMKILISIFILVNIFSIKTFAMVSPTSDFYVNDYAKLLSADTKNYIITINKKLYAQTGAQIVVVTVPNLEGDSLEEYATALFRKFGIGDKTKNNGVLLLLALEERQFRVEVGYGLEGRLNDAKTGRIQDEYIIPYLKNNNWNEGIRNGFNAILQEISKEYGVSIENVEMANRKVAITDLNSDETLKFAFIILVISIVFGVLTRWVNIKFGIVYAVYLIGGIIFLKFIWKSMSGYLQISIYASIGGYIIGLIGDLILIASSSGESSSGGGSSGGGGGSSGGGRKFEKFLIFEICLKIFTKECLWCIIF